MQQVRPEPLRVITSVDRRRGATATDPMLHSLKLRRFARLRALLLAVFFLCLPAVSHAITLKEIRDVYEQKFDRLKSYRIRYTEHTRRFDDKHTLFQTSRKAYERYAKDGKFGVKEFPVDLNGVSASLESWAVYNGDVYKWLSYEDGEPVGGRVRELPHPLERYDMTGYQPLAMVGLHSAVVKGDRRTLLNHTDTTDMVSLTYHRRAQVLPQTEMVNGHKCCVLQISSASGRPKFQVWLALDLDLAVVKRNSYARHPTSGERIVFYGVECDQFVEIEPSFFLPQKIVERVSRPAKRAQRLPAQSYITEYVTTAVELNPDIPDEAFELEFAAGVFVVDQITGRSFTQAPSPSTTPKDDADLNKHL